jgi:hypothetical protein
MERFKILALTVILTANIAVFGWAANEKKSSVNVRSQEIVGKIAGIDLENSTIDLEYELDEQTHQTKTDTFYITDATTIDVATAKSSLNDLKMGTHILVEYAQMPDGAKVVESVWVKK